MKKRLAIITTHPIQYNAPLFALLSQRGNIQVKVFYTWGEEVLQRKYDPGFNKDIEWDIPLLGGYDHSFVKNISPAKGSHHFKGIDNPGLVKDIQEWHADAVLVYGWAFKSHLKAMRYFHKKIPVFFRGDSTSLGQKNIFKKTFRAIFLKWVYRHVDTALYVGTHNQHYFLEHGLKPGQLKFAPHAIDNDRFAGNEPAVSNAALSWRKELNIPENALVFLFAAKLDDNKNAALLIDCFIKLQQDDSYLLIAGNGEKESQLHADYGNHKQVRFLPFQNQTRMPELYRVGDVFVLPSKAETWGLSLNEAMACSRAVLASDTCGAAIDLIQDGVNGYIFRSNDPADLADKMQKLVSNKAELKNWGTASFELIKDWNYTASCKTIETLMTNINGR